MSQPSHIQMILSEKEAPVTKPKDDEATGQRRPELLPKYMQNKKRLAVQARRQASRERVAKKLEAAKAKAAKKEEKK